MGLRVVKDAHGSTHDSYPFLLDSNEKDKALIRNLVVYRPFLQKKGEQTPAWKNVVEMMLETKTADGKKVFEKKMSVGGAIKSAKKRLRQYIKFMKNYRATKPAFNSGGDNEPFSDNLRALEDLYDLYESFKNASTEKQAAAADARARDRAEGDAIREASLGLYVASREEEDDDDHEKENDNPDDAPAASSARPTKKNNRRQSSGSGGGRYSAGEESYQKIESLFKKYTDDKKEDKRRCLEYNERRLALEEKRAEDERAARLMNHEMMMSLIANLNKK
jgi:hypothetical protein